MPEPTEAEAALAAHFEPAALPDWYDPAKHAAGTYGIHETLTGALLAADGLPESGPLRAQRMADAEAVTEPVQPRRRVPTTDKE